MADEADPAPHKDGFLEVGDTNYRNQPHYSGHRDRLRAKFRENGAKALADYELLELVLFRSIPRRDVKPLAKALIAEFGSFSEVVTAPAAHLSRVKGLGESAITELKIVHAAAMAIVAVKVGDKTVLGSWTQVLDYCRAAMAYEEREQFRILFLDKKNRLIRDEVQQVGTVDHAPVYPREVVKRALELSATAVILVHNHPSGDPYPSRRYRDDENNHGYLRPARDCRARPHHHCS